MWYTSAFNRIKISGMGGGILPPFPKTNNKIATEPEAERMRQEVAQQSIVPPPPEKRPLQSRLETLHTNGQFPVPITQSLKDIINKPAAIEDQHPGEYQEYTPQGI